MTRKGYAMEITRPNTVRTRPLMVAWILCLLLLASPVVAAGEIDCLVLRLAEVQATKDALFF